MNQNNNQMINSMAMKNMIDSIIRENHKNLKKIFSPRIKANFMIEMLYLVMSKFPNPMELFGLFDMNFNGVSMVTGDSEAVEYEICRNIVSLHRSNCIFLTDQERIHNENSNEYKDKLANDVIRNLKLRRYSAVFFRKKQLIPGDEFLFFHVPYQLFSVTTYSTSLISSDDKYKEFYTHIFNKSLSALVLMEGNFLDSCYPLCRGIIELYLKLLVLKINENALEMHDELVLTEIKKNCCGQDFDDDFNRKWSNRKNQYNKNKVDFLHYGWVDLIDDYHNSCGPQPYSANGLFKYLITYLDNDSGSLQILETLYKMCHTYTHGNVGNSRYPLLHYFEITIILYTTVLHTYKMLCEDHNIGTTIENIDVCSSIKHDAEMMFNQYSQRSTEKFDSYYRYKK